MKDLPWFICNEIIDYIVSYNRELCLVNKEWFNYSAGRFMNLNSKMILKKKRPSDWFKISERLQLNSFSNLNKNFLTQCHKIKCVSFKLKQDPSEIPMWFIQFLLNSPLETVFSFPVYDSTDKNFRFILEKIRSKVKYLYLNPSYYFDHHDFFNIKFLNLTTFEVRGEQELADLFLILKSMPNLESLKIMAGSINLGVDISENLIFNKLKKLEIARSKDDHSEVETDFQELFRFNFPVLKIFKTNYFLETYKLNELPNSMPSLETLHLESLAPWDSSKFPTTFLPTVKDLRLHSGDVSEIILMIDTNNLPQLQHLSICNDFDFSEPKEEICYRIVKLKCHKIKTFSISSFSGSFTNLTELTIDCNYLNDKVHEVFQLCDRVSKLTLLNLNQEILPNSLPLGPFKTTQLSLKGREIYNTNFIDWVALNFHLSHLTLNFKTFINLQIYVNHFSHLQHFDMSLLDNSNYYNAYDTFEKGHEFPDFSSDYAYDSPEPDVEDLTT